MFTGLFQPHPSFLRPVGARHERVPNQEDATGDQSHADIDGNLDNSNNRSSNENNSNGIDGNDRQHEDGAFAIGGENGIVVIRGNQEQQRGGNGNGSGHDSNGNTTTIENPQTSGASTNEGSGDDDMSTQTNLNVTRQDTTGSIMDNSLVESDEEEGELHPHPTTHPFLNDQIQSERELRYRRQSTCTLIILFFLVRVWIEAIIEKDVALMFIAVMGTTWTYRWMVARREHNEEYDRQIEQHMRNRANATTNANGEGARSEQGSGADAVMSFDPDLGLMSFQAQLALAILESQRQMFENGGYGGNDRSDSHSGPGVTSEAKSRWKRYEWGDQEIAMIVTDAGGGSKDVGMSRSCSSTTIHQRVGSSGSNYGSVSTAPTEDEGDEEMSLERSVSELKEEGPGFGDEEPSCSICLCEYEPGEAVTRLPCSHIYHVSCVDAWTTNHIRCPLCNYDLMEGFEHPASQQQQTSSSSGTTFGRRRSSRRSIGGRRRFNNAVARAAMEDSIV